LSDLAKIKRVDIPKGARAICVSDIHGELDLFKKLLCKAKFDASDVLILLGDLYSKGSQSHETVKFCMELSEKPNVHVLKGNCDWSGESYLSAREAQWLGDLPHIIDSDDFVFVHAGLTSNNLQDQQSATCMKHDNFMELAPVFDKWVVTGHWPVNNYCHEIHCCNPIVNEKKRVIAIDGGNVLNFSGQLNAFIIEDGRFSHVHVDNLPTMVVSESQEESGGSISVAYLDRFVEIAEDGEQLCRIRHLQTGKILTVPKSLIWEEGDGNICCVSATDYHLPCAAGDSVSLVQAFPDRILAKANGVLGWINTGGALGLQSTALPRGKNMSETLRIEKMTRGEIDAAYALYLSDVDDDPERYLINWFNETIDDPYGYFFAAYWGGEFVGWCGMYHQTAFATHYCKIGNIVVKKDFRRKGIGRALMLKMLGTAEKLGLDRTKLEVDTENGAVRLYESLGFQIEETEERFYDDGSDAYIMWRYSTIAE